MSIPKMTPIKYRLNATPNGAGVFLHFNLEGHGEGTTAIEYVNAAKKGHGVKPGTIALLRKIGKKLAKTNNVPFIDLPA